MIRLLFIVVSVVSTFYGLDLLSEIAGCEHCLLICLISVSTCLVFLCADRFLRIVVGGCSCCPSSFHVEDEFCTLER